MISPTRKFIGNRIRALRKTKKMTQADLAEALGCENSTISRYELGSFTPDSEQLVELAKIFGVSPMDMLPAESDLSQERLKELHAILQMIEIRSAIQKSIEKIDNPVSLKKILELAKYEQRTQHK